MAPGPPRSHRSPLRLPRSSPQVHKPCGTPLKLAAARSQAACREMNHLQSGDSSGASRTNSGKRARSAVTVHSSPETAAQPGVGWTGGSTACEAAWDGCETPLTHTGVSWYAAACSEAEADAAEQIDLLPAGSGTSQQTSDWWAAAYAEAAAAVAAVQQSDPPHSCVQQQSAIYPTAVVLGQPDRLYGGLAELQGRCASQCTACHQGLATKVHTGPPCSACLKQKHVFVQRRSQRSEQKSFWPDSQVSAPCTIGHVYPHILYGYLAGWGGCNLL